MPLTYQPRCVGHDILQHDVLEGGQAFEPRPDRVVQQPRPLGREEEPAAAQFQLPLEYGQPALDLLRDLGKLLVRLGSNRFVERSVKLKERNSKCDNLFRTLNVELQIAEYAYGQGRQAECPTGIWEIGIDTAASSCNAAKAKANNNNQCMEHPFWKLL